MKLYLFLLSLIAFTVLSYGEQIDFTDTFYGYDPYIQNVFEAKTSSHTSDKPIYVGRTVSTITINAEDREVWVVSPKSNTKDVFWGFEATISTMNATPGKVNPGSATMCLEPNTYMKFEKFYGKIFLINEDLSVTSSTINTFRFKNLRKVR